MNCAPKILFVLASLLAGRNALAQHTEVLITGGMNRNWSNIENGTGGPHLNFQMGVKVGNLFPNRMGIGLVYEVAKFTSDVTISNNLLNPLETTVEVANPQHFLGVELYRKFFVSARSYVRLGGVFGYALGRSEGLLIQGVVDFTGGFGGGLGGGLDAAFVFPLVPQLSGAFSAGLRGYSLEYGDKPDAQRIGIWSTPFTVGLNFEFAGNRRQGKRFSAEDGE